MKRITFAKIAYELSWLHRFEQESIPVELDLYSREIRDTINGLIQIVEEDIGLLWDDNIKEKFLNCVSIEDGERLYDILVEYSSRDTDKKEN